MQASPPGCSLFLLHPLLELVDATAGIDQLLPTGKEGMAFRTDVNVHFLFDRTRLECFTTGTVHDCLAIFGMNALFHDFHLS